MATRDWVLISSRFDGGEHEAFVRRVTQRLKDLGLPIFIVQANAGTRFGPLTMEGLFGAYGMVAFVTCTPAYGEKTESKYCTYHEVKYANEKDLPIICVQLGDTYPPTTGETAGTAQNSFVLTDDLVRIDGRNVPEDQLASKIQRAVCEITPSHRRHLLTGASFGMGTPEAPAPGRHSAGGARPPPQPQYDDEDGGGLLGWLSGMVGLSGGRSRRSRQERENRSSSTPSQRRAADSGPSVTSPAAAVMPPSALPPSPLPRRDPAPPRSPAQPAQPAPLAQPAPAAPSRPPVQFAPPTRPAAPPAQLPVDTRQQPTTERVPRGATNAAAKVLDAKWEAFAVERFTADTSKWKSLHADRLEPLLKDMDLVDAKFVVENIEAGLPLPRYQDVPTGARINSSQLYRVQECVNSYALSIVVVSCPWLDADHPDKQLIMSNRLLPALQAFVEGASHFHDGHSTVGVIMDYMCLPHPNANGVDDRTPAEKARHTQGLHSMYQWLKHPYVQVLIYDLELPAELTGHSNLRPYMERGWCAYEFRTACLVKAMFCFWSLKGYERSKHSTWAAAVQDAKHGVMRSVPVTPDAFEASMREGVAAGTVTFTKAADLDFVIGQYRTAFASAFSENDAIMYQTLKWPDSRFEELANVLKYAREKGILKCTIMHLWGNDFTDKGKTAVEEAVKGTNINLRF